MDFVVSKVAMSICALLVASVLAGVLDGDVLLSKSQELDEMLTDLSMILETTYWSGAEGVTSWSVPLLSDGKTIDISVHDSTFSARAGEKTASIRPACDVHAWQWNGSALNRSCVDVLDSDAPPISVCSGQTLEVRTQVVAFENQQVIFEFIRVSD